MDTIKILVIHGTVRPDNMSQYVAKVVNDVGYSIEGVETRLINPADFDLFNEGNGKPGKPEYKKMVEEYDAFFIVTPEYNHTYPGILKALLDMAFDEYKHKPVAYASVSSGNWGGVRAIEGLLGTTRKMGMVISFIDVNFPRVNDLFDDKGNLQDKEYIERVEEAYGKLLWIARSLKWGRENLD